MLSIMNVTKKRQSKEEKEVHFHKCYCPFPAAKKMLKHLKRVNSIFVQKDKKKKKNKKRYHAKQKVTNSCKKGGGRECRK